jgi:prephenate dehydrogenase
MSSLQPTGCIITIVGLGLMGGSLAAALMAARRNGSGSALLSQPRIRGVARRDEIIAEAIARGIIDEGTCDPVAGVADAEIVVFGTPVRTTVNLMRDMAAHFKRDCIVSDLGSTKTTIVQAMSELPPHVDPIGGHPMCGREVAGLAGAAADLFQGRAFILTPLQRTSARAVGVLQDLVQNIGARCVVLEPARHDRLVAAISHLPYLLSACLVSVADDVSVEDERVWDLVSSGFRDMSRLAGSEPAMMRDIFMTNQDNIHQMIDLFRQCLTRFDRYLADHDETAMTEFMRASRSRREGIYP